jgi:hypothetical protein
MNNEPVAFMHKTISSWVSTFIYPETEPDEWLPLYTHPADESFDRTASHMAGEYVSYPAKTLTDEEIEQVRVAIMGAAYWCADENMSEAYNAVKVCCGQVLEILVKAQEK